MNGREIDVLTSLNITSIGIEIVVTGRMMKVISLKTGTEYVPSAEVLEKFEVDLPDSVDASALPMIVEGELQGDLGYQKWASHETDPEIIELLLRNGREETKHAERIKKAIKILASAEAAQ